MNLPKDLDQAILLYLYDELNPAEKEEFETHLRYNPASRDRLEELRDFHQLVDQRTAPAPSEAVLEASRLKLRERLRAEKERLLRKPWRRKWFNTFDLRATIPRVAGVLAVLFFGIFLGRFWPPDPAGEQLVLQTDYVSATTPAISDIDMVSYDPKSGLVTVHYKSMQEVALQGNIQDPAIRRVLSYTIRDEQHPGRRLEAVKAAGRAGFKDDELQAALIKAMLADEIDGVRLRAAKALKGLPLDDQLKNAFIRVLLDDPNPAVRIEAVEALSTVTTDDMQPVFRNAAAQDENEFVRLKAARTLERTQNPEVLNDIEE